MARPDPVPPVLCLHCLHLVQGTGLERCIDFGDLPACLCGRRKMWNFTVGMQLVTCNVSQELCNKVMELLIKHQCCCAGSSRPCPCSGRICSPECTQPQLLWSSHMLIAACGGPKHRARAQRVHQPPNPNRVRGEGGREHSPRSV